MNQFLGNIGDWITTAIQTVNGWVWSPVLVGLCLVSGLYFSLRTRFVQVRRFGEMFRLLFSTDKSQKTGITSFQAFAMALSGRVGTGNIVGVATAIGFGGPGAIVWMWVIAFFGAGSAFVEATLAQIFKENHHGQFRGGPAYYIEKGLRSPFMAMFFAVLAAVACGVLLPPVQCNGIALSFKRAFNIDVWIVGLGVATLIGLVIIGGVKRIANVAQIVAPFMALIYIVLAIVVLAVHYDVVPVVFMDMLRGAVGINEVGGALLVSTIAWGVKRGIYSNEAGQGTGPIVAAAAKVSHPVKQGLVQAFSVYIDTLLVCTATALMILACKTYNIIDRVDNVNGGVVVTYLHQNANAPDGEPGVFYTSNALGTVIGNKPGDMVISIALFFFAFTTIMAYYYYAETNLVYLFSRWRRRKYKKMSKMLQAERIMSGMHVDEVGKEWLASGEQALKNTAQEYDEADRFFGDDRGEKIVVWMLRSGTIAAVFCGSLVGSGIVWTLGDIGVGAMAWINIVAILLLSPKALRALNDYEKQKKAGVEPLFDPKALEINNAEFWENSAIKGSSEKNN